MRNKELFLSIVMAMIVLQSCKNGQEQNEQKAEDNTHTIETTTTAEKTSAPAPAGIDLNSIAVSKAPLGEFPFFSLPAGLAAQNKPLSRSFDRVFFPVNGTMLPVEGRVWKSYVVKADDSKESWSLVYFQKSFDDAIKNAGGVVINDQKITGTEMDRIKDQATYFGEEGSLDYWNDPVKAYIIRRENGDDIYIQMSGNTASGALQILQKTPFKQTITLLKSDEIKKDLDEKGKAVLHINFDTDKSTLKADGKEAVAEILKVLQQDKSLNLAINGYTDNSGTDDKNQQLSAQRAETVKNELMNAGIDQQRMSAAGFGSKNPIADNGNEDGKAQNRRVELVKK